MDDKTIKLQELKDKMAIFTQERNWDRYQNMRNLAISLVLKASETLKDCQWMSEKELTEAETDPKTKEKFSKNLMDILTYILTASNKFNIDLTEVFYKRYAEMVQKYPAETFTPDKNLSWEEDNKEYYKIKEKTK